MRIEYNVDSFSHEQPRLLVGYVPESDEDVKLLEKMWADGEISVGRRGSGPMRRYFKIDTARVRWVMPDRGDKWTDEAAATLARVLDSVRPGAREFTPAIFLLKDYFGQRIGMEGLQEIADQARMLAGDDELFGLLPENARALLVRLSVIDLTEGASEGDLDAPGIIDETAEPEE
jgi:hypothetical protein